MAKTEVATEKLELRRTYPAPRDKVFRAWTNAEAVKQWFPPPGYEAGPTTIDLRPSGAYRWGLRKLPDGEPFFSTGKFVEIDPPRRLVCTWRWSSAPESMETILTVEFQDRGGGTEVVIRHERFPDVNMRNEHEQGWSHCLDQLAKFLKKKEEQ